MTATNSIQRSINYQTRMARMPSAQEQQPDYDSNDATAFIKAQTSAHDVVIFSKSYCPYCRATKDLFAGRSGYRSKDVKIYELDQMPNGPIIQSALHSMTGQRTVPSVWVKNQFLGGNDDTQAAFHSGKLDELLLGGSTIASEEDFIKNETNSHDVVIFSKSYCPFCRATKHLVGSKFASKDIAVYELDEMPNGRAIQSELYAMTGHPTVPNVWVANQFVGGNDDMQAAFRSGKLQEMLG